MPSLALMLTHLEAMLQQHLQLTIPQQLATFSIYWPKQSNGIDVEVPGLALALKHLEAMLRQALVLTMPWRFMQVTL